MYNGQYIPQYQQYNPQTTVDNIDEQINRLQKIRTQIQQPSQPTSINQTFQIAPTTHSAMKYANSMDDVKKEMVMGDTPFFTKDMTVLWVKSTSGDVKTYELNEIVAKDEKDLQIALLQGQIEELKKEMRNHEWSNTNVVEPKVTTNTTRDDETNGTTTQKGESSGFQRVSTSKKGK